MDTYHLIYRAHGPSLLLRDLVRDRFERATHALEALRRTLAPLPAPEQAPAVFHEEPQWVTDVLDAPEVPAPVPPRRVWASRLTRQS